MIMTNLWNSMKSFIMRFAKASLCHGLIVRRVMKFVHHLVISDVSIGLLACEVVIGLEYVVEVSPETP